jgi:glycosyltransferase involved in cell wall biosynthesis
MKPRILHFLNNLHGGGAEMMLCNLLEHAAATQECEHVVLSLAPAVPHPLAERIRAAATRVYHVGARQYLHPRVLRTLWRVLHAERPQIVQTWLHKSDFVGGVLGRLSGAQPVWGIHSMDVTQTGEVGNLPARLFRKLLALVSHWAPAAVVTCSQAAQARHESWGYADKFHFIPNGIDTNRFRPSTQHRRELRTKLGIPPEAPVVGFVGRLAPVKDVPLFVRAAEIFAQHHSNAHFILCGDPASTEQEVAPRERFHRLAFQEAVERIYPAFDVFALTSVSEAFPMVLLEAMACGVPCASTDVGDARVLLNRYGAISPVGDAAALAANWSRLLTCSVEQKAAIREQSEEFSIQRCVQAYHGLYRSLTA